MQKAAPANTIYYAKEEVTLKRTIMAVVTGLLVAATTAAFAGNKEGQFSLSPMVGGITFDGKQHLETSPVIGGRVGYNFTKAFGVEALIESARSEGTVTGNKVDFFRYGGELLYHFMPDNSLVPYVAAGYAGINFDNDTASNSSGKPQGSFDYGVGLKYFFTENLALRGDVRHLIYKRDQTLQAVEYMVGIYIPFGGTAAAAKPVEQPAPAKVEAPPAPAPEPAKVVPPPPPAPTSSLAVNPNSVNKGVPVTLTWTSQNATDCRIQPGIGPVKPQGSMTITPVDNTTYTLACSGAGGNTVSTADIAVVVPSPPVVEAAQPKAAATKLCSPTVLEIAFDTNKADIKPAYHGELDKVGEFLKEFPNAKGTIEGHTDNVGNEAINLRLSQRRADSVRSYIIKNFGIAPERISAKGYGLTKPIADNKTKEGKAKNRRIEANFTCE